MVAELIGLSNLLLVAGVTPLKMNELRVQRTGRVLLTDVWMSGAAADLLRRMKVPEGVRLRLERWGVHADCHISWSAFWIFWPSIPYVFDVGNIC